MHMALYSVINGDIVGSTRLSEDRRRFYLTELKKLFDELKKNKKELGVIRSFEVREDSKNYACTVVKLPPKQKVEGLDKLVKVTVFGNDVLTQKDTDEEELYLFFPAECRLSTMYLWLNNEYRDPTRNRDKTQKGYFEDTGRVKSIKFKGVISTGYIAPVTSLEGFDGVEFTKLKEGDEFTDINGVEICRKYKIVHQHATTSKESRFNKKLKRFDKLVPNQFRFHVDTNPLAKYLHHFQPGDIISITDKWHGTSAVFSNVLINKKLNWREKIAKWLLRVQVIDKIYDLLYASRSVIKNQYINETATVGFYNEDIWKTVQTEIKDKIEQGITIYGEIVGYLRSGKMIQKDYDYGCSQGLSNYPNEEGPVLASDTDYPEHKFLVYRITYTKPDGSVIEFSWKQIKEYCKKHGLEHVKEYFHGKVGTISPQRLDTYSMDVFFEDMSRLFLEKDCIYCRNKVPAEGIVVRLDGLPSYSAYKLKSKRFFERETKQLDEEAKTGEVNIEDQVLQEP